MVMSDIKALTVGRTSRELYYHSMGNIPFLIHTNLHSERNSQTAFRPIWEQMWADYGGDPMHEDDVYRFVGDDLPRRGEIK
jgi:hypothetical protein